MSTPSSAFGEIDEEIVEKARRLIAGCGPESIVVLTGAGISTDSGIPDFRGPEGLWTLDPTAERDSHISTWLGKPEYRRQWWARRATDQSPAPEPNPGHRALLTLEERGQLALLVTQNIDGLHHAAGHEPSLIIEIHGTEREVLCLRCDARVPMGEILERVRAGEEDPHCHQVLESGHACEGLLKAAVVSFGQDLNSPDFARANLAVKNCSLLLVVGSSLDVYPVADLVPRAKKRGGRVVIVNGSPTEYDSQAAAVVRGSISQVLPRITA